MITLKFKCSYENGYILTEEKKNYKFNSFEEFCEHWQKVNGQFWTVKTEGNKLTATTTAGKIYEYTKES